MQKFIVFSAPIFGIGLSGKTDYKFTSLQTNDNYEKDIKWGPDEEKDDLKRLDNGLTMGAGLKSNSVQIGICYSLGLANISTYSDDDIIMNNRVLEVSVGYKFRGK